MALKAKKPCPDVKILALRFIHTHYLFARTTDPFWPLWCKAYFDTIKIWQFSLIKLRKWLLHPVIKLLAGKMLERKLLW